ncbi:MAG: amidase, partial [Clostridia bacterium]|nr:amidase [Clostridia bacterium]
FIINNKSIGPYGREVNIEEIEKGDIIQLSFDGIKYHHSLIIIDIIENIKNPTNIFIASHTEDSYNRRLSTYTFSKIRFIKIDGVRYY